MRIISILLRFIRIRRQREYTPVLQYFDAWSEEQEVGL